MSVQVMSRVFGYGEGLTPSERLVLLALADHANDEGICWPGLRGVAQKCDMTKRTIQRTLRSLADKGVLAVTPQYRDDGSQGSNQYVFTSQILRGGMTEVVGRGDASVTPPMTTTVTPNRTNTSSSLKKETQKYVPTGASRFVNDKQEQSKTADKPPKCVFDFEAIWKDCLREMRKGKKEAERHFNASVNCEKDWQDIQLALRNYKASREVASGYIKNGSSWFNQWRDWIEQTPEPSPGQPTITYTNLAGNLNFVKSKGIDPQDIEKVMKDAGYTRHHAEALAAFARKA